MSRSHVFVSAAAYAQPSAVGQSAARPPAASAHVAVPEQMERSSTQPVGQEPVDPDAHTVPPSVHVAAIVVAVPVHVMLVGAFELDPETQ